MTSYMIFIYRNYFIQKIYIVYVKASLPCLNIYCIIIFTIIYAMSDDILYNNDYSIHDMSDDIFYNNDYSYL